MLLIFSLAFLVFNHGESLIRKFTGGIIEKLFVDKYLPDKLITRVTDIGFTECMEECSRRQRCLSVNYARQFLLCELNYENKRWEQLSLETSPFSVYSDKRHWKQVHSSSSCLETECGLQEQCREKRTGRAECVIADCGFPSNAENTDHNIMDGIGVYAKVTYECKNKCLDGKPYIGCLTNGSWSRIQFTCQVCPPGWLQYESSCYIVVKHYITWHNAQAHCKEIGAYLAEITSESENDFINDFIHRNSQELGWQWIGGKKEDEGNQWIWTETKLPIGTSNTDDDSMFSKWYSGRPDNSGGNENCLALGNTWFWDDLFCARAITSSVSDNDAYSEKTVSLSETRHIGVTYIVHGAITSSVMTTML